jgi:hypothetical protein
MAYNPVARGGISGASGPTNNLGAAQGGNDQFSMQNVSPEDYLGTIAHLVTPLLERANVNNYLKEAISLL